jgi:hypothetical protein
MGVRLQVVSFDDRAFLRRTSRAVTGVRAARPRSRAIAVAPETDSACLRRGIDVDDASRRALTSRLQPLGFPLQAVNGSLDEEEEVSVCARRFRILVVLLAVLGTTRCAVHKSSPAEWGFFVRAAPGFPVAEGT